MSIIVKKKVNHISELISYIQININNKITFIIVIGILYTFYYIILKLYTCFI